MRATDPVRREAAESGPVTGMALLAVLIMAGTLALSAWTLPPALTLPSACLAALVAAVSAAGFAWAKHVRDERHPNCWDLARALTLVGMCAAMLSEPDQVWPLLEAAPRRD